jgi:hypothetical protein
LSWKSDAKGSQKDDPTLFKEICTPGYPEALFKDFFTMLFNPFESFDLGGG